jgi:hypothetical protein
MTQSVMKGVPGPGPYPKQPHLLGRSIVYYLAEEAFKQRGDDKQQSESVPRIHQPLKNTGPSLCGHRKHP